MSGVEPVTTLATYTLELTGPSSEVHTWPYMHGAPLLRALRETEENLTDLLPPGYSVKIREWDKEDA